MLPGGAAVLVDGGPAGLFADRLAAALESAGRRCVRPDDQGVTEVGEVTLVAGGRWRAHPGGPVGLHDATWPVIRVAAGPDGTVIGLDLTPEMLANAR